MPDKTNLLMLPITNEPEDRTMKNYSQRDNQGEATSTLQAHTSISNELTLSIYFASSLDQKMNVVKLSSKLRWKISKQGLGQTRDKLYFSSRKRIGIHFRRIVVQYSCIGLEDVYGRNDKLVSLLSHDGSHFALKVDNNSNSDDSNVNDSNVLSLLPMANPCKYSNNSENLGINYLMHKTPTKNINTIVSFTSTMNAGSDTR
jgi:hypothetical protein